MILRHESGGGGQPQQLDYKSALICKPQIRAWSMTRLLKPEANAGCRGPGQSSGNRGLLKGSPHAALYTDNHWANVAMGKEAWPGVVREGAHQLCSTHEDPSTVFSVAAWLVFKGEEN